MVEAAGARHVDAAMDRVDPGGAGEGHDDPRGAQDRQPTDDPQASIQGPGGQGFATRDGNLDHGVGRRAEQARDLGDRAAHHVARYRIDGGLAGRQWQAWLGDCAHTFARAKRDARAWRAALHRCLHQSTMRDVGIVAGILHDADSSALLIALEGRDREGHARAGGQFDLDRIGTASGDQRLIGRARRRRRAGARGPAAPQRSRRNVAVCLFLAAHAPTA